ncbi:hypothetical protein NF701_12925 [Sphingomonadaceae bacterium OTU29THOMA1]|nr:hypothetical protein NF701_12925 [Sphingomonadaceae bacterium OTU29THOMA1]
MSTPPVFITEISKLIGSIAVLGAGVRIFLASWDAPAAGALPSVITERDRERHDGQLNVRQVLLTSFGGILVIWAARHLLS